MWKGPATCGWHGIIFATAGAFVVSVAEREGLPAHEPYWLRERFEQLQGWRDVVAATREDWLPVVRGTATLQDGLRPSCAALPGRETITAAGLFWRH
jgi:hypothetical protein